MPERERERLRRFGEEDGAQVAPEAEPTTEIEQAGTRLLGDRRRMLTVLAAFLLLIVGHLRPDPEDDGRQPLAQQAVRSGWGWVAVAVGFNAFSFVPTPRSSAGSSAAATART